MKSGLPALIMLLSEFGSRLKPDVARRDVQFSPVEALVLTQPPRSAKPAILHSPCLVAHCGLEAKRSDSDKVSACNLPGFRLDSMIGHLSPAPRSRAHEDSRARYLARMPLRRASKMR